MASEIGHPNQPGCVGGSGMTRNELVFFDVNAESGLYEGQKTNKEDTIRFKTRPYTWLSTREMFSFSVGRASLLCRLLLLV